MNLFVTKRNGHKEPIDLDKIHRVLDWAAEGLDNVSVSQVELKSHIQFYDGIRTADIHETVIKAAADLISEQSPDYQYMAARLAIFHLRKKAYGQFEPPHLYQHVAKLVDMGKYDKHLLEDYSQAEFEELNQHLDHWRDMDFLRGGQAAGRQVPGPEPRHRRNLREPAVPLHPGSGLPLLQVSERYPSGLHQALL